MRPLSPVVVALLLGACNSPDAVSDSGGSGVAVYDYALSTERVLAHYLAGTDDSP